MKTKTAPKQPSPKRKRPMHKAEPTLASKLQRGVQQVAKRVADALAQPTAKDTVSAIKSDHDALREFLGLLKNTDRDMTARRQAYVSFSALLQSHSMAEEKAVYSTAAKLVGREMHLKVAEGYVEHRLADDVMKRIKSVKDPTEWSAHANVLAEVVEHHLQEEERELLPKIRKAASPAVDAAMLRTFRALRAASQKKVTKKNAGALAK